MSALTPTIREELNNGVLQNLSDIFRAIRFGDIVSALMDALTATQAAATVTSNSITLANAPISLQDVVATTATVTGRKAIRIGPTSGFPGYVAPITGECLWGGPGTSIVQFAAADAVTAADFTYFRDAPNNPATSLLNRTLTQNDQAPR